MKAVLCLFFLALVGPSLQAAHADVLSLLERMTKELKNEQKRDTPSLGQIESSMRERSINSGRPIEYIMGELLDQQIVANNHQKRTSTRGCDPDPCEHDGTCNDNDIPENEDHMCYGCEGDWSGLNCDVEDACGNKDVDCKDFKYKGCYPSNTNHDGRICY